MKIQSLLLVCTLVFSGVSAMENNSAVNELVNEVQNWTPEEQQRNYESLIADMPEDLRRNFENYQIEQQSKRKLSQATQAIVNEFTEEDAIELLSTWLIRDDNFQPPFSPIKKTR